MIWEEEALKLLDEVPVPPMMAFLVKHDAERRAKQKGLHSVSAAILENVSKGYERTFGKEAAEMVKAMLNGEEVDLPEEFFEEDHDELYRIEICPAKFGACTADKREMIRRILIPVRKKLKDLNITRIIKEAARTPLMSHHVFRIALIGCPNCCMSPYFSDIGIIAQYKPGVMEEGCIQCNACLNACVENAILLNEAGPFIDNHKCVMCGACETACLTQVIYTELTGYKVVAGGTGSRHPKLAETVTELTDRDGVIKILDNAVSFFRNKTIDTEISFHDLIEKYGVDCLKV